MRTLKISLLISILPITLFAQERWFWQNPLPQENNYEAYSDIFVYDSTNIWAVTNDGNIWRSTDGGLNWSIRDTQIDTVYNIHFTNLTTGWLLTSREVYTTIDGGQNWTLNFEPDSIDFRDMFFISDSIGFIVGNNENKSKIYRTTDSGNEWNVVLDSMNSGLFRLGSNNEQLIWIVGNAMCVFYTNDLGITWETIYQAPPYVGFYLFQAQLFDNNFGIIGDGEDQIWVEGFLKFTTNGGLNWLPYGSNIGFDFGIGDFHFLTLNEGWVSNGDRDIFYTSDSGATWETLQDHTSLPNSISEFDFIDSQNAWGLTYQEIIQTKDGWHSIIVRGTLSDIPNFNFQPEKFILNQNYPNPFNPSTKISYQLPESGFVSVKVFDVLGNEIATLVNEEKPAGEYEVEFKAVTLPSGIYLYQLKAGTFIETKKMILLK